MENGISTGLVCLGGRVLTAGPRTYSISGSVPGDLLTDLQTAKLIGDPLHELNFKNSVMWHNYTWTYSTSFSLKDVVAPSATEVLLVFDGEAIWRTQFRSHEQE